MKPHISFLRGINVGGKNILPMKSLSALFEQCGASQVVTYIQSGNVVFALDDALQLPTVEAAVVAQIQSQFGFAPAMLSFSLAELEHAIDHSPYDAEQCDPATLHYGFLAQQPDAHDLEKMHSLRKDSEQFELSDRVFYLSAPEGIGRSKLAASAERCIGVAMTMRNFKTVMRVREIARGLL
ncbi:MAG: DUF1697 domain-containing protein [Burkholderiales bacterium]|nr:DUF1697 domain-containing protein [Burkholderiales bacterium]